MDLKLKDSSVLVTGSSSGIGKAAAIAFGAEGANVGVTYHANRAGPKRLPGKFAKLAGRPLSCIMTWQTRNSIRSSLESVKKEWGMLNVLVNNAAPMEVSGPTSQLFEDVPLKNWEEMLRKSLEGLTLTVQCALPLMRKSGWGRIVNVSSDATDGWPGLGPTRPRKQEYTG